MKKSKLWTTDQDNLLIKNWNEYKNVDEISKILLDRTPLAVMFRLRKLDLITDLDLKDYLLLHKTHIPYAETL